MDFIGGLLILAMFMGFRAWALDSAQRKDDRRAAHIKLCKVCQTLGYVDGCNNESVGV